MAFLADGGTGLRADSLCQLIRTAGEEILCTICREHPHFYKQVGTQDIAGVSLACEQSVELLLACDEPLLFCQQGPERTQATLVGRFSFDALLKRLGIAYPAELCCWQPEAEEDDVTFVLELLSATLLLLDDEITTSQQRTMTILLPFAEGALLNQLHMRQVVVEEYMAEGVRLLVRVDEAMVSLCQPYVNL